MTFHPPTRGTGRPEVAAQGLDNTVREDEPGLLTRCRRHGSAEEKAASVRREAALLAIVADVVPVPVPRVCRVDADAGCLVCERLPGRPLLEVRSVLTRARVEDVAAVLGGLLAALHATPADRVAGLVEIDDDAPAVWLEEASATFDHLRAEVPPAYRERVAAFLATAPPERAVHVALSHNDLGIEHVLVDDDLQVTGVIDWTDCALVDPAVDFGRVLRDLGPVALDRALEAYGLPPEGVRDRAWFYARCGVLEDLAYGLEEGAAAYAGKSLSALAWLFPPR